MLSSKILETIPLSIRTIRRMVAASLDGELTFQQFRVLGLAFEGMSQTQMSQSMQVSMAAVSKVVDNLVRLKLLTRTYGKDRRCTELALTKEGKKIRNYVKDDVTRELDRSFKKLTKKEQTELNRGLEVLEKLMGLVNEK